MKKSKNWKLVAALLLVLCSVALVLPAMGADTGGTAAPLPQTTANYWDLAISAITPLLVTGIWWLVPKIPKWALPLITPVVGIVLGLLVNWLASANLTYVDMAKAGALAVFVREVFNQAITKNLSAPTTPPPAGP